MNRKLIETLLLAVFITVLGQASYGAKGHHLKQTSTVTGLITYKTWKLKKIQEAKSVVEGLRRELKVAKRSGDDDEAQTLLSRLNQALLNLGVVKELSANDYFVLYLMNRFKSQEAAFAEAAHFLSKQDVAEILKGYRREMMLIEKTVAPGATADLTSADF